MEEFRFEHPEKFKIGEEFSMKIVKITEPELLFVQAEDEPEVFVILEGKKCWVQTWETAKKKGWDKLLKDREIMPLAELNNKYPTGGTILWKDGEFVKGDKPRDIYFPEEPEPYPFAGLRGLLTLNPKPNGKLMEELGFNASMPYRGTVSGWNGDLISIPMRDNVILRFTRDEPDCRKENPEDHLAKYKEMKRGTPDIPVGFNLNCSIGCGHGTQKEWIDAANQVDYVSLNLYPYRDDWPDAMEKMKYYIGFWKRSLKVPVLPMIQAHWGWKGKDYILTKPNALEQIVLLFAHDLEGYVVYCWADAYHGVRDAQAEWAEANQWAADKLK